MFSLFCIWKVVFIRLFELFKAIAYLHTLYFWKFAKAGKGNMSYPPACSFFYNAQLLLKLFEVLIQESDM